MQESEVLEMEYSGQMPLPRGLTELGLAAGPMYGRLLRNLQLPPGLKVGNPTSLKDSCCCCVPRHSAITPTQRLSQALRLSGFRPSGA